MKSNNTVDAAVLIHLLVIAAVAFAIGATLHAALRPTILPNPGVSAYRAPVPEPAIPRIAVRDDSAERLKASIATAQHENELLGMEPTLAFAASPGETAKAPKAQPPRTTAKQKPHRTRTVQRRPTAPEPNRWAAREANWGSWFR